MPAKNWSDRISKLVE